MFGALVAQADALKTASFIAITEVATKFVLYFLHERAWSLTGSGIVFRKARHRETMRRTTIKTGLWRLIASLDTFALAWFFTLAWPRQRRLADWKFSQSLFCTSSMREFGLACHSGSNISHTSLNQAPRYIASAVHPNS